jgi:membrane-associated phospholipid phosphatase
VLALLLGTLPCLAQNCGWSRVDRLVNEDSAGLWNPNVYRSVLAAMSAAGVAGALWEGSETRLGKTMWQGIDSQIIAGVASEAGKRIFERTRPYQGDNPCLWFQGKAYDSFPSGETSLAAALVTPYVLEYGAEKPASYALLLLPLWVGTARVKNQAHWQSDVLAAWAVGGLSGWFSHSLDTPILIRILPGGFEIGFKAQF